ncbi:MAG: hypothetical protein IKY39_06230 [Clostridia bacterium]|nr:hypothetical protein [Clostridia bacterium]
MKKKSNIMKILLIIVCLASVTLFSLVAAGVNIPFLQTYKTNFKHNISGISNMMGIELPIGVQLYLDDETVPTPKPTMVPKEEIEALEAALGYPEEEEVITKEGTVALTTQAPLKALRNENLPVALDGASNAKYADFGGNLVAASETRYRGFDNKGELLWELPIQMQSPQITVRGEYVLINETGAKKILLFKGKKQVFEATTEGNIITCDLSRKGDVVAVTEKEYYKGQVVVLNSSGKVIFAWDSGSYNILDAAISDGRKVAISLLNTDVGADSMIACLDVNGKEKYRTENFSNSIIFDLEFDGESLNAIADDKCIGLSKKGKILWEYDYSGRILKNYDIAVNGSKMLLFDNGGVGEIVVVSRGGKAYDTIKTESMPDVVSIKADYIAYNSGRDIIVSNFKGKAVKRTTCSADIKQACAIEKNKVFCVYNGSIQVKKPVRVKKQDVVVITAD